MATTNYNLRIDQDLRDRAFSVFESYGLAPAQAMKLFLNQVADTRTIPLSFSYNADKLEKKPNAVTLAAMQEAQSGSLERYSSLEEMMKAIQEWQE